MKWKRKFLLGLFSKNFYIEKNLIIYKFLGVKYLTKTFENGYGKYKLFGFLKFKTKFFVLSFLISNLFKIISAHLKKNQTVIAYLNRSGEAFIIASHIKEYLNKNDIKEPFFVFLHNNIAEIFKMFYPNIKYMVVPKVFHDINRLYKKPLEYNGHKYIQIISTEHNVILEREKKEHFYSAILKKMQLTNPIINTPIIQKDIIKKVEIKLEKLNIKNNFIFISPDAFSNSSMPSEFWDKLSIKLYELGYDILYNKIPANLNNTYNKTCKLSLSEAYVVAEKATCVIGVRSGLLDIISPVSKQLHCIYLPFKYRSKIFPELDCNSVQKIFSIKKLPYNNPENVYEYSYFTENLIDKIIQNITKREGNFV